MRVMSGIVAKYARTNDKGLSPRELLAKPVGALIGTDGDSFAVLQELNIATVFDLAVSTLFSQASALLAAAENARDGLGRFGMVPRDLVDNELVNTSLREIALRPMSALRAVDDALGTRIQLGLDVGSIREFALWPLFECQGHPLGRLRGQRRSIA
jgi:hypothetical protein